MLLAGLLAAASVIWMLLLVFAAACPAGAPAACRAVFDIASHICHQQPARSFHWEGSAWPVCARCLGLYAASPAAAIAGLAGAAHLPARGKNFLLLCTTGIPTLATWLAEHAFDTPVTNLARFAAALPLGAAIAWLLVRTARNPQYTLRDARRGQVR